MSAVAAVLRLDAGPVDPAVVRRMIASCAADVAGTWVDGPVAVAECRLGITEAVPNQVPLADAVDGVDAADGIVLAWDGRLDNRPDLLGRFGQRQDGRPPGDAAVVLAVYRAVGPTFLDLLVGDFALVVWDGRTRRLLAARDQLGVRPLHYAVDGRHCWIASRINQLREMPHLGQRINEQTLGRFLAGKLDSPDETFFQGISRVPPGCLLEVDHLGLRVRRYWSPDWEHTIRYRTDAEYVEHFRAVLRVAVRSRLRSVRPVGLLLSGGVDSAAIAWATGELHREKNLLRHPFATFTTLSRDLESSVDRRRVKDLGDRYNFVTHYVPADSAWTFADRPTERAACDEPVEGMYAGTVRSLIDRARDCGVGGLLTGYGGDLLLGGNYYYLFDLLTARQWSTLLAELRSIPAEHRWRLVRRYLARPLLLGRPAGPPGYPLPGWVAPDLTAAMNLASRPPEALPRGRRSLSRRVEIQAISLDQQSARMLWYQSEGARRGMELRHPFFDRRVFEFLLSVPMVWKLRQGRPKAILHRALSDALPPVHLVPGESAEARRAYRRQLRERERAHWEECFTDARSVALGYIDRAALDSAFRRYYSGDESLKYALARTFRAELWLKRLFSQTTAVRH